MTADLDVLPVTHDECGGVAFFIRADVRPADLGTPTRIRSADVRLVGGGQPRLADRIRCGSCLKDRWLGPTERNPFGSEEIHPEVYRGARGWRIRP